MSNYEIKFTRGFNSGYLLAKYLPELMSKINPSLSTENDYSHGFLLGSKEYELERMNELRRVRNKDRGREKGLSR